MMNWIENLLLNKLGGKLAARAATTLAGLAMTALAGDKAQSVLAKLEAVLAAAGHPMSLQPNEAVLTAAFISLAHAAFELFKAKRMANPASPAVQTDLSKLTPPAKEA